MGWNSAVETWTLLPRRAHLRDAAQELEELRGADDRVGIGRALDQRFLGDLGAEIAARLAAARCRRPTTPRAAAPRPRFPRPAGCSPDVWKNSSDRVVLERRRVRHVDDHLALRSASARPSPVMVLTPVFGDAATTSWPLSVSFRTTFEPIRPVPPMTTIFMGSPLAGRLTGATSRRKMPVLPRRRYLARRRGRPVPRDDSHELLAALASPL